MVQEIAKQGPMTTTRCPDCAEWDSDRKACVLHQHMSPPEYDATGCFLFTPSLKKTQTIPSGQMDLFGGG